MRPIGAVLAGPDGRVSDPLRAAVQLSIRLRERLSELGNGIVVKGNGGADLQAHTSRHRSHAPTWFAVRLAACSDGASAPGDTEVSIRPEIAAGTTLRGSNQRRSSGQSLVEFALILPVILLLTMVALDFGRVYLGWVNLQNMTRAAANFAANNPTAWATNNNGTITKYNNQVLNDAKASNCRLDPATPVAPTFTDSSAPDGIGVGDNAAVTLACKFQVITPVISSILGGSVNVSSSAVFPVKNGISGTGSGTSCILPIPVIVTNPSPPEGPRPLTVTFTYASAAGEAWLWDFGDEANITATNPNTSTISPSSHTYDTLGDYTVTLAVTNDCGTMTTTADISVGDEVTLCTVPSLVGSQRDDAEDAWAAAGFDRTKFIPQNGNFEVKSQSIVGASEVFCSSSITVSNKAG